MTFEVLDGRNNYRTMRTRVIDGEHQYQHAVEADYHESLVELLEGDAAPLQADKRGRLRVNSSMPLLTYVESALVTVGSTPPRSVEGYDVYGCSYFVENIGTNIVAVLQGSLDGGLRWGDLDSNTVTANGTYFFASRFEVLSHIRFLLKSISGGAPTVYPVLGMK